MHERLTKKKYGLVALTYAGSLLLGACSSDSSSNTGPEPTPGYTDRGTNRTTGADANSPENKDNRIVIQINANTKMTFFADGTAEINPINARNQLTGYVLPEYLVCVGYDLHVQIEDGGGSPDTQVNSPKCLDKLLTPEDYPELLK